LWLALILAASPVWSQATDVPPDHWAHQAVTELAEKGLVLGYPDGRFLGNRTLTRYELASIIKRVVDSLQATPGTQGPPGPAGPQGPAGPPGPLGRGASPEDLVALRTLVEEFRVELTVIGTDMKTVKERLDAQEKKIADLEQTVRDPKGPLQTVMNQVTQLRRLQFSGYVQARYESFENSEEGTSTVDRFTVRRTRLVAAGRPTRNVGARLQADFASDAGNPPNSTSARTTVQLKDAWIDYYLQGDPRLAPTLTLGQMKWPFGFEVTQSSGVRETPERATWSRRLFPDERDRGFKVAGATANSLFWEVGLFNGTGINTNDNNNEKDVAGRLRKSFGTRLTMGVSGYSGKTYRPASGSGPTAVPAREFVKTRYGADFQYALPRIAIRGEYVDARDLGRDPKGWLAQLNYSLGTKNLLVAKYDEFDEDLPTSTAGKLKSWNLGFIRSLDTSTRLKLFYQINDEERSEVDNDGFTVELITVF